MPGTRPAPSPCRQTRRLPENSRVSGAINHSAAVSMCKRRPNRFKASRGTTARRLKPSLARRRTPQSFNPRSGCVSGVHGLSNIASTSARLTSPIDLKRHAGR